MWGITSNSSNEYEKARKILLFYVLPSYNSFDNSWFILELLIFRQKRSKKAELEADVSKLRRDMRDVEMELPRLK